MKHFWISIWCEVGCEWSVHELDLDITEEEITAERINGEHHRLAIKKQMNEEETWQGGNDHWPVTQSCIEKGKALTAIMRSDRGCLAFMTATWE